MKELGVRELRASYDVLRETLAQEGEVILTQGDSATDFYVIRRGFVKITTNLGGAERVLAQVSDGQFFGEWAERNGSSENSESSQRSSASPS